MVPETPQASNNSERLQLSLRSVNLNEEDFSNLDDITQQERSIPQKLCSLCHFSCLHCLGPNDYDCRACAPDSVHTVKSSSEAYCYPVNNVRTTSFQTKISTNIMVFIGFISATSLIITLTIYCLYKMYKKFCGNKKVEYEYDRVEMDIPAEDSAELMKKEIQDILNESESDFDEP